MKKRTLFLIEDGSFSFDNRVVRETDALIEDGWDVTVICPKDPRDPFYRRDNEHRCVYFFPRPETSSAIGHVFEHSFNILAVTFLAWFVFLRHGFRVIHACNPMDTLWIPALPFKLFGVRYIFDHHDLSPELYLCRGEGGDKSLFFRILTWLEKMSFRFADVVISTNESYRKIALDRGEKSPDSVFVVRNGPNLRQFKPVPPRDDLKEQGDVLVGYLGNMNPQDGVDYLLRAAEEIVAKRGLKHMKFVFVGGASYQPTLERMSVDMGLEKWVTFTGRLPDDEMLSTLCACDICVQPDPHNPLNDKSTMNKVMEYMALGKPLVQFDLTEGRRSALDASLYAAKNDEQDLADKIIRLLDDPALRKKMGEFGRQRIENELQWTHEVPKLLAAYDKLLG